MRNIPERLLFCALLLALSAGAQAAPKPDSAAVAAKEKASGKPTPAPEKASDKAAKSAAAKSKPAVADKAKDKTKDKAKDKDKKAAAKSAQSEKKQDKKGAGAKAAAAKPASSTTAGTAPTPARSATPLPRPRPVALAAVTGHVLAPASPAQAPAGTAAASPAPPSSGALPPSEMRASAADLAAVKQAVALVRKGRSAEASALQSGVRDSAARKLIEWTVLRSDDNEATSARYRAFVEENPNWATVRMFRRRAENQMWSERPSAEAVRAFFARSAPTSAKGRFTLARALLAQGDRSAAAALVRETWRHDEFGADLESQVLETFGEMITRADHKARMDRRLYADDTEAGLRAAKRLGPTEQAIAKARGALNSREDKAAALFDALPQDARSDAGVVHGRIVLLRRNDSIAEAAKLMLAASRDPNVIMDTDEWWIERRLLARKLLDVQDFETAYYVVRDAVPPKKDNYRAEHEFTAGWIALRFLNNPSAALTHFARVGHGTRNPITLARGAYWQGRALEALGRHNEARAQYEAAARHPTAYYGQIARNKLGVVDVGLRRPPHPEGAQLNAVRRLDIVRAVEILYDIGERDLVYPMVADLADRVVDVGALVVIAEIAQQNKDARALVLIGKAVLSRGYAFDQYAFPTIGVPAHNPIGPEVDRSVVYAIVRQESAFNQRTISTAKALGLMQVTPPAGRYIARRFGVTFNEKRLLSDPIYNTQFGSAELGSLLQDYRGSYILSFAAYNAGRGRVSDWIKRFGDPREAAVDPIDWVERIPFSETRNYVQRVMENMQVYRARFAQGAKLLIEADLRRGGTVQ